MSGYIAGAFTVYPSLLSFVSHIDWMVKELDWDLIYALVSSVKKKSGFLNRVVRLLNVFQTTTRDNCIISPALLHLFLVAMVLGNEACAPSMMIFSIMGSGRVLLITS